MTGLLFFLPLPWLLIPDGYLTASLYHLAGLPPHLDYNLGLYTRSLLISYPSLTDHLYSFRTSRYREYLSRHRYCILTAIVNYDLFVEARL